MSPTKKNGRALLQVVVHPYGSSAAGTMLLMLNLPLTLTAAPPVVVPVKLRDAYPFVVRPL